MKGEGEGAGGPLTVTGVPEAGPGFPGVRPGLSRRKIITRAVGVAAGARYARNARFAGVRPLRWAGRYITTRRASGTDRKHTCSRSPTYSPSIWNATGRSAVSVSAARLWAVTMPRPRGGPD